MIRINMTRISALRNILRNTAASRDSVAWGKTTTRNLNQIANSISGNIHALVFSAVLIACSVAVGCSSDKPKPVSSNNQIPVTQPSTSIAAAPAPIMQAESKPAPKKIVHKKPATVNYTDKTYGVNFEYPRRYAIETGDAAADLLLSSPVPMNFVQPGGVALAAVELPETGFANTDFSSAFFNVSVHKSLTADQCTEFAVPQPKTIATSNPAETSTPAPSTEAQSAQVASTAVEAKAESSDVKTESAQESATQAATTTTNTEAKSEQASAAKPSNDVTATQSAQPAAESQGSKLLLGDMELRATEAVSGEGTRQSDSKYFHIFQNGACYEFALNVTTVASQDGLIKHVDRDKVFSRLEKILDTVKIDAVKASEASAEVPATTTAPAAPAQ